MMMPKEVAALVSASLALTAFADDAINEINARNWDAAAQAFRKPGYFPCAGRNFPTRPFFCDTHVHTAVSPSARVFGNTLGPEEPYRLARDEKVVSATGEPVKLGRPLDFLVDADHAESLGAMMEVSKGNFDPTQRAFYYGRVIEIPTPRWTADDAKYYGITMPKEVPMTLQERAYTPPIWYTPAK